MIRALSILFLSSFFSLSVIAQDTMMKKGDAMMSKVDPDLEEERFTSSRTISLNGSSIRYSATAGETFLRNEKTDLPEASVFSIAYIKDDVSDPTTRPVTFIFNGGPGSASLWLHMGAWGPRRVATPGNAEDVGGPPYPIVDNDHSLLDVTDMVFIDPIGTGYSRALGDTDAGDYYGLHEDAESIAEFVRIWLTENGRWNSPKYVAGESYGTTRAAALTEKLQGGWNGVALNGVILVSAILDFQTARFASGNDTPHLAFFPTWAATAWHHGKIDKSKWDDDFDAFIADARTFAIETMAPALLRGDLLPARDMRKVAREMSERIGVSAEWIMLAKLRVDSTRYRKELLRTQGYTVGRFDSRYRGVDSEGTRDTPENDPSGYSMDVAYVAAANDYLTRDLGVEWTRKYKILTGEPGSRWNWQQNRGQGWPAYVNAAPWLGKGMRENRDLRVLLASGWYDMATPFFGAEIALAKNGTVQDRIDYTYYQGGHMMYLVEDQAEKLASDVRRFIRAGKK